MTALRVALTAGNGASMLLACGGPDRRQCETAPVYADLLVDDEGSVWLADTTAS